MPTQTLRISVPEANYVAVTDGHYNAFIRQTTPVPLRLHVGQTLPAADTTNYLLVSSAGVSLSDLEGGDKVYLRAEGTGGEVVVIRGG